MDRCVKILKYMFLGTIFLVMKGNKKMKICLVHEEYPNETNFGGIATYQKTLAEELAKTNKVTVITRGLKINQHYFENNVEIYRLYTKKGYNKVLECLIYRKKVANLLKKLQKNNEIDIIETPDWGAETILFNKTRKIPLVVRLHTPLKVWLKYNNNNIGKSTKILLKWENYLINKADYITCCSKILKKKMVSEFDIDPKLINVNPNPANLRDFYWDESIKKENVLLYVGSLEERKGLIVLAKSLNIVLEKYPDICIYFIGKDTKRNKKNISTIDYIKNIIKTKYQDRLYFLGQKDNNQLNYYLNKAAIGVFPSLFDNFPYVVLEAMATGLNIVGSDNSGMVEMLNNDAFLYKAGNYKDLAEKISYAYELYKREPINFENINRVKCEYLAKDICKNILNEYKKVIQDYNKINMSTEHKKKELEIILNKKIISFYRSKDGVANEVYIVKTLCGRYIIKKYLYNYNFEISNDLYKIYEKNNLKCIKPLNDKPILYNDYNYNIFQYVKSNTTNNMDLGFLAKIIYINGRRNKKSKYIPLSVNINKYERYLKDKKSCRLDKKTINFVIKIFDEIKNNELFSEKYYNHGDISKTNILHKGNDYYIIDFDESCISYYLYDFSVICVKFFVMNNKFDYNKIEKLARLITKKKRYKKNDYYNAIIYYLCKILMEKFYLHEIYKIDLFDNYQKKDFYKIYLNLLKDIIKKKKEEETNAK